MDIEFEVGLDGSFMDADGESMADRFIGKPLTLDSGGPQIGEVIESSYDVTSRSVRVTCKVTAESFREVFG